MAAKKIIWAVDPYQNHAEADQKIKEFFKSLSKQVEFTVTPTYVMGAAVGRVGDYFQPIDFSELLPVIRADMEKYLASFKDTFKMDDYQIVESFNDSQAADVRNFDEFVRKMDPDFVFLLSNGRSGWARTFLGSFAEGFLLRTDHPTFIVNPRTEFSRPIENALFPMEMNDKSKAFVEKFLDDHKLSFVKQLKLFHKMSISDYQDVTWGPALYESAIPDTADLTTMAMDQCEKYMQALMSHPLAQQRLSYDISTSFETIAEAIQGSAVENNCGLVVVRSNAGPWESRFLGSATKAIVREVTSPVIVYPYHYQK